MVGGWDAGGARGGQNRTSREEETVRRAGRGRPGAGRGPAPPRGRTTHILVVPAIGLVHDLPVGEVERAGLAALQRRRLEVHADGRGSTLFLRAGRGHLDRRARVLVLDVARRPLRGTLLLDSRPRRRDATHPPRVLLLRGHHRPERARSLAACPDGTSSTVDARVRERASPTARPSPRGDVSLARRVSMANCASARPAETGRPYTGMGKPYRRLDESQLVDSARLEISQRATWHRCVHARSPVLESIFALRGRPRPTGARAGRTRGDGCRLRRAAGVRGRAPISRTRPALTR